MSLDAFLPAEMSRRAEAAGTRKSELPWLKMFVLAVLAGAFIALGAVFATVVTTGGGVSFGITRLLGGLVFCLGLILVVVAGAELFTGNNLIVMAWANRKVTTARLLRNWGVVYAGNFVGSVMTALIVFASGHHSSAGGQVGRNALAIADAKLSHSFVEAVCLGILCNALVCLAIWLCMSARTTTDKILAIVFPITAFVAAGFEHSIANMFFIPVALFIKGLGGEELWAGIGGSAADYGDLTWLGFFTDNLLPVTIGNIIGGSLMVGLVYWFIYLRAPDRPSTQPDDDGAQP